MKGFVIVLALCALVLVLPLWGCGPEPDMHTTADRLAADMGLGEYPGPGATPVGQEPTTPATIGPNRLSFNILNSEYDDVVQWLARDLSLLNANLTIIEFNLQGRGATYAQLQEIDYFFRTRATTVAQEQKAKEQK